MNGQRKQNLSNISLILILIFILIQFFVIGILPLFAANQINHTKNKLQRMEQQIKQLNDNLLKVQDKRGLLNRELAETETKIGTSVQQLRHLQTEIGKKQQNLTSIEIKLSQLTQHLKQQQQLLGQHVKTRYQLGEYLPLKWLLNQDNPETLSRLLTFYQYLMFSRVQTIEEVKKTQRELKSLEVTVNHDLAQKQKLQLSLQQQEKTLALAKDYHSTILKSLNKEIQSKQTQLTEYKRNRDNLTHLLKNLTLESKIQTQQAFSKMKRKLPRPVISSKQSKKINNGIAFLAAEGSNAVAVYSGKVVFSDWLNGYGLLLILDHGQGYMSLYAHNQSLFKRKGDFVKQGEVIAAIGHSGGMKENGLYFEIRYRGKTLPPLDWLS